MGRVCAKLQMHVLGRVKKHFANLAAKRRKKTPGLIGPAHRQTEVMKSKMRIVHTLAV
jgi:hypothetical protein